VTGRAAAVLALALAAPALAGCGERSEPTGATVRLYPVTVENTRGPAPVSLARRPQHVVAIDGAALRILRALGVPTTLAADEHGSPKLALLRRTKPGLIVAGPSNDPLRLRRLGAQIDAPIYVADGGSIAGVERSILELGVLTDRAVQGRRLVAAIGEVQRRLVAKHAGETVPTVFVDLGLFSTVGARSLIGELIAVAGGRDVVEATADSGPIRLTHLAKLDPDVYIASSDSGTTLADLRADPATGDLRAVREGRFALVPARLLDPGPYLGRALLELDAAIHARAAS
jgi:ABC-type Fe3+-hydroxamate transport system substrate-binding protein